MSPPEALLIGFVATGREQGDERSQRAHQATHEPYPYEPDSRREPRGRVAPYESLQD